MKNYSYYQQVNILLVNKKITTKMNVAIHVLAAYNYLEWSLPGGAPSSE